MAFERLQGFRVWIFFYKPIIKFKKNSFTSKEKSLAYSHIRRFEQFWQFEEVLTVLGPSGCMRHVASPMHHTSLVHHVSDILHCEMQPNAPRLVGAPCHPPSVPPR